MSKTVFMFPGQGSQYPGMGKELYDNYEIAREVFRKVEKVLGKDFLELVFYGDDDELRKTENAQPAIYSVSVASFEVFRTRESYHSVMGHSLGEFTALYSAGVFSFEEGLKLVRTRGEIMSQAQEGTMCAVIGMDEKELESIVSRYDNVVIANYNAPDQLVISGPKDSVVQLSKLLKDKARRVVLLNVSGAFHSPLMEEASKLFQKHLERVEFREPKVPIFMNASGKAVISAEDVKRNLMVQLRSPVRFVDMVENAYAFGARRFVELGPGKVLQGLVRRILRGREYELSGFGN